MQRYLVTGEVTISVSTMVKARSKSEARRLAMSRSLENIHTDGDDSLEWTTSGELDGMVKFTGIEVA